MSPVPFRRILLTVLASLLTLSAGLGAQDESASDQGAADQRAEAETRIANATESILQEFQDDVLRVLIFARVRGDDEVIIWYMEIDELTVPGRGVNVRLNGQNIVVEVEFTPYRQENDTIMLVAQGQTWITSDVENKLRYQTSLKSIPINAGEPVVFYPLGIDQGDGSTLNLELEITVTNYVLEETDLPQTGGQ